MLPSLGEPSPRTAASSPGERLVPQRVLLAASSDLIMW